MVERIFPGPGLVVQPFLSSVIMQNTPLGPHNLQTTLFLKSYANYPRNKMKIELPPRNMKLFKLPAQTKVTPPRTDRDIK